MEDVRDLRHVVRALVLARQRVVPVVAVEGQGRRPHPEVAKVPRAHQRRVAGQQVRIYRRRHPVGRRVCGQEIGGQRAVRRAKCALVLRDRGVGAVGRARLVLGDARDQRLVVGRPALQLRLVRLVHRVAAERGACR